MQTQNPTPQGFPLNEIYEKINSKIETYTDIAAKTHKVEANQARRIINSELENYLTRLQEYWNNKDAHKKGTPTLSLDQGVNIFLEVMQAGLSFSQIAGHVYLSRLKGTGTAVGYQVTVDGMIYLAQKAGAIDHLSEAVIVQTGEQFAILNTPDGRQVADHTILFDGRPMLSFDQLLLGYVYIVYPNGQRELSWIDRNQLDENRQKSPNPGMYNNKTFLQTKVVKHALKKVRNTDLMMQLAAENNEVIQNNMEWEPTPAPVQASEPAVQRPQPAVQINQSDTF